MLRAAIRYESSPAGFAQLLAAMDAAGEIDREVRGRRTYRVSLPRAATGSRGPDGPNTVADEDLPFGQQHDWNSPRPGQSDSLALSLWRMAARLALAENSGQVLAADPSAPKRARSFCWPRRSMPWSASFGSREPSVKCSPARMLASAACWRAPTRRAASHRRTSPVSHLSENELLARLLQAAMRELETG